MEPFLPNEVKGHLLLTSRAHIFAKLGIPNPLELDTLPLDDAIAFLFRRTDRDQVDSADVNAATELVEELGRLPLALEQAAAYIQATRMSFAPCSRRSSF